MRVLWTLFKIAIVLALGIPLAIILLATALGILGTLFGLAVLTLKWAVIALIGYGAFHLISNLMGGSSRSKPVATKELPPVDPYYEAARRELDRELGDVR
jgi:predicted ferric reductase